MGPVMVTGLYQEVPACDLPAINTSNIFWVMCQFSTYFFQELFKRSCPPNNNPGGFGNAFVSAVVATLTIRLNGITLLRTMKLFNKNKELFLSLF